MPHPLSRPHDVTIYAPFLISFLLMATLFDCIPLYPASLVPAPMASVHAWYIDFFNDFLIREQPSWFKSFSITELVFEVPICWWAASQLRRLASAEGGKEGKGRVYPVLVVWGTVCAYTTWICVIEYAKSAALSEQERWILISMFGGYGAICKCSGKGGRRARGRL